MKCLIRSVATPLVRSVNRAPMMAMQTRFAAGQAQADDFVRTYTISPDAPIKTCRPQSTMYEVAAEMRKYSVGSLLVTDDNARVVGIITERDFVKAASENRELHIESAVAMDCMTPASMLESVKQTCGIKTIMHKMVEFNIRHMPVTDNRNRIMKVISIKDVQCSLVRQLEQALDCITSEPNTAARVVMAERAC